MKLRNLKILLTFVCASAVAFNYVIDTAHRPSSEKNTFTRADKAPAKAASDLKASTSSTSALNTSVSTLSGNGIRIKHETSSTTTADMGTVFDLLEAMVVADPDDIASRADNEARLLEQLEQSPQLIGELLKRYPKTSSKDTQRLIRELLVTSQRPQVEKYALEQVANGDPRKVSAWLSLLRDAGLTSPASRAHMFKLLEAISQPEQVRSALLAFTPYIVPLSERDTILDDLHTYTDHADETIRSAAIKTIGKWGNSADASTIETALFDASPLVRQTAIQTAFTSTIRSDGIKSKLLNIIKNSEENWHLRIEAHSALTGYTLDGDDYQDFYEFHQLRGTTDSVSPKG